jgi:hypothetical protein
MNCQELIAAMTEKNLWSSPGGLTPHATLYSAADLNVPSVATGVPQGMLLAPGTCPPRWAVSFIPGGAITLPVYSSWLRTSTSLRRLQDVGQQGSQFGAGLQRSRA